MPTIGIDARMWQNTGIGTYLRNLVSFAKSEKITFCGPANYGLDKLGKNMPFNAKIYSLSEQLEYPNLLRHFDLWHSPHYNIPWSKGKTKLVVTVHDIIHWKFWYCLNPIQIAYAFAMFRLVIKTADWIIAVSENTKNDLIREFRADPKKITVVYEGVSNFFGPRGLQHIQGFAEEHSLPNDYYLYVGLIKPHKNIFWLANNFRYWRKKGLTDASLVILGPPSKNYSFRLNKPGEGLIYLSNISFEDLPFLYCGAKALLHPSLYEGFGLTLLEAMACGTPVIANRVGSIPEVTGGAAALFDANDDSSWQGAIQRIEENQSWRSELRQKGLEQARRFSWDDAAIQTFNIYRQVLNS